MNILNILNEIEKVDGEIYERLNPRRKAMKDFFSVGKKVSLAALPLALGSMFTKAYGQTAPANVTEVLQFALALEYLEWNFYNHALEAPMPAPIPAGAAKSDITVIRNHERAHVNLLKTVLKIASPSDPSTDQYKYANFQFEAVLADVFTNYQSFLKVATALEDTGVRAYKGQAGVLLGNAALETALQIHAVEARHAAHLRTMTAIELKVGLKPWISYAANGNDTGIPLVDGNYAGEQNTSQLGVEINGIFAGVDQNAAAACFDEPLTGPEVKNLANAFIKTGFKLS